MYFVKTPRIARPLFRDLIWNVKTSKKRVFLTFDDGPTMGITDKVLGILSSFHAKATFFCLGKNVTSCPELYRRILDENHVTGNHSFNHLNGWKTKDTEYLKDIENAASVIKSNLFRPPYGKITKTQTQLLAPNYKIIMWDVLSADFDSKVTPQKCANNVIHNVGKGSIVIFHDSLKAADKMLFALPKVLEHFTEKGYSFDALPQDLVK